MKFIDFLFCLFLPCSSFASTIGDWQPQQYGHLANRIVNKFSDELTRSYGYHTFVSGGSMTTDIRVVSIGYRIQKTVDVAQARNIYVAIARELLKRFNADKDIRPYLHNYPFTAKNLNLELLFTPAPEAEFFNNDVAFVLMVNGQIAYCKDDKTVKKYIDLHEETYEEALSIVQGAKRQQFKVAEGNSP